jgi:aminoglycoside phosphotransferase (APT) family kinase protein
MTPVGMQEYLSRNAEPSRFGEVDLGARARERRSRAAVRICGWLSLGLLGASVYAGWRFSGGNLKDFGYWLLLTPVYLGVAYVVHPAPNRDNMGWLGGLVDNPFRVSDGVNRLLAVFLVLLWPGRFVAESLVALVRGGPPAPPEPPPLPPHGPGPAALPWPQAAPAQPQPQIWPAAPPSPPVPPAASAGASSAASSPAAPDWTPEEVVSPERAAELIGAQFPELAPVRVSPLGAGWDNTAYRVNDSHVFRFPRREIAVALLETEARVLPAIAGRLPLPIPQPTLVGRPTEAFGWPFTGYPFLEGRTACRLGLDEAQRAAVAEPLGHFLAALHGLPVDEMVALGVSGDSIGRLDLSTRVPRALEVLGRLPPASLGCDAAAVRRLIEASAAIRAPTARVLAHGDLYVRHLLIDEQGQLCGIIDWGDLHVGNPAVDLAVAHGFLPPAARSAFLRAYGRRVPAPTWWLARFRAIFSALCILDYGRQTGEADLEREGRISLANAIAGA